MRILIADDHAPTRIGVREVLEDAGFDVVAEAPNALAAVEAARTHRPDVCLLDLNMPGGGGIKATEEITRSVPESAVVILTVSRADEDLFEALIAGAKGYLLKDIDPDDLPGALRGVLAGEAALPPLLAARLISEFRDRARRRKLPADVELTQKEWEVLDGIRAGLSTREIAEQMVVSTPTVRTHVSAILRKLAVPDREAAVRLLEDL